MDIIIHFFRSYPEMAIFLTLGIGFWIGSLKYKNFSLGTVTSVLLVGVLVGQMNIDIPGPLKSVFFLLFLFAIGYSPILTQRRNPSSYIRLYIWHCLYRLYLLNCQNHGL